MSSERLRKSDWFVADAELVSAQKMVRELHYSRGGSNTAVYVHGLYRKSDNWLAGIAWWLPPTRVAAESVNKQHWKKVLALTRLVIQPNVPANACSFLLARSRKMIVDDSRFVSLVTYADESQGHTGAIYKADNWEYVGRTGPYQRWLTSDGRQVAPKSTVNRTKSQMLDLGHTMVGRFYKHKFVRHIVDTTDMIEPYTPATLYT